jgi:acyl-CoA reductase-like NAD-dependent aldehyde dehydrogenase
MDIIDTDLISIQEARILAENAGRIRTAMGTFSQEDLDRIVEAMLSAIIPNAEDLARLAYCETDMGIETDKLYKIRFMCDRLANVLRGRRYVGVITMDEKNRIMDVGVPLGPIAAFCPVTSPVTTTIYNAAIAVKSGNPIIFSPHPFAMQCMTRTLEILAEAAYAHGMPEGGLSWLTRVTMPGSRELMTHEAVSIIINTGVPGIVPAARASGKPTIVGGLGNGPAFIERTADVKKAVRDVLASKTFDYGIVSAAEQALVVDRPIDYEVRRELEAQGGYFMRPSESETLGALFYDRDGKAVREMVGISAQRLAKKAGFFVPESVRVLISEQKYVTADNPYAKEKLCPVLAYFVEDDWMDACEKCIELLLGERRGHTLVIHSNNGEVITQFALKKPVGRMLVNTPSVLGGMGVTTNLFPAMTLGSASAGEGITSDNVSPMNLIYIRKIGYGVREIEVTEEGGQEIGYPRIF